MKNVDASNISETITFPDGRKLKLNKLDEKACREIHDSFGEDALREIYQAIKQHESPLIEISLKTIPENNKDGKNQYLAGISPNMGQGKNGLNCLFVGLEDGCDIEKKRSL